MTDTPKKLTTPVKVESLFSYRQEAALRKHLEAEEAPLSPAFSAQLFELFLNGLTLEQIVQQNPGLRLGALVRAAKDGCWHDRLQEYKEALYGAVRERVVQTQSEVTVTVTHMLAMMNKRFGDRILEYLQTGDESKLGELKEWGLPQYKTVVDLLMRLTGQDGQKKVHIQGTVDHNHKGADGQPQSLAPSAEDAAKLLEVLSSVGRPRQPQS